MTGWRTTPAERCPIRSQETCGEMILKVEVGTSEASEVMGCSLGTGNAQRQAAVRVEEGERTTVRRRMGRRVSAEHGRRIRRRHPVGGRRLSLASRCGRGLQGIERSSGERVHVSTPRQVSAIRSQIPEVRTGRFGDWSRRHLVPKAGNEWPARKAQTLNASKMHAGASKAEACVAWPGRKTRLSCARSGEE